MKKVCLIKRLVFRLAVTNSVSISFLSLTSHKRPSLMLPMAPPLMLHFNFLKNFQLLRPPNLFNYPSLKKLTVLLNRLHLVKNYLMRKFIFIDNDRGIMKIS